MPPKRPKSETTGISKPGSWETGIAHSAFNDEGHWTASVVFVVGRKIEDYENIKFLVQGVKAGYRKLFSVISQDDLFELVQEIGRGGQKGKGAPSGPQYSEICDVVKPFLDNGEEVPLPLLAKLIKFKLLDTKSTDVKRRDVETKGSEGAAGKGKGDKKDRSKSAAKGKKEGKKTPEVPTGKNPSKLKMRGEEVASDKFINDEPDDGPQHYVIVTGFHHPHMLNQLAEIGVLVDGVLELNSDNYGRYKPSAVDEALAEKVEKDEKTLQLEDEARRRRNRTRQEIALFWRDFPLLCQLAPASSHLHNVASMTHTVTTSPPDQPEGEELFGRDLFEVVACQMYDLLDHKRHWQGFLKNLKLLKVPTNSEAVATMYAAVTGEKDGALSVPPPPTPVKGDTSSREPLAHQAPVIVEAQEPAEVDLRYYNDLLSSIPDECISPELVMFAMLKQLQANEEGLEPPSETPRPLEADGLTEEISSHFDKLIGQLGLPQTSPKPSVTQEPPPVPKLVHYLDECTQRLANLPSVDGFNALEAELSMLGYLPLSELHSTLPEVSTKELQARAARLQELVHFVAADGLTQAEVDRCFKQFVYECLDMTSTDEEGKLVKQSTYSRVPWDDPYPYYKGMTSLANEEKKKEKDEEKRKTPESRQASHLSPVPPPHLSPVPPPHLSPVPPPQMQGHTDRSDDERQFKPILKRSKSSDSNQTRPESQRSGTASSVHFERDATGELVMEPGDSDSEIAECKEDVISPRILNVNDAEWSQINEQQKRMLDQWCFAEHLQHDVLIQILEQARRTHSVPDVYYHRRDHTLLLMLHNPGQYMNRRVWTAHLYSNVGLRNYLKYISHDLTDWARDQDARHQAEVLAAEVQTIYQEIDDSSSQASDPKGKGKKTPPVKGKQTSRKGSAERTNEPEKPYIRAGSIKAWQDEQEKVNKENEGKEKKERGGSGKKKVAASDSKLDEDKSKRQVQSKTSNAAGGSTSVKDTSPKDLPFKGYELGDHMIRANGETVRMFPADGAVINTETAHFEHGAFVRTTLYKDGHSFTVHVLDPKNLREKEEQVEQESANSPPTEGDSSNVHKSPEPAVPEPSDAVGRFGSFVGQFKDGLALSLSQYGPSGAPKGGALYRPANYEPPPPTPSTPQPPADGKASQTKSKGKRANTPEPQPVVEEIRIKSPVTVEPVIEQPLNILNMTCPDGLTLEWTLASKIGVTPASLDDRRIVVRQSYPFKKGREELSRLITADGQVIKVMKDGRVVVLHADGAVSECVTSSPLINLVPPKKSTIEVQVEASPSKKTGSRQSKRQLEQPIEEVSIPVYVPAGFWITTTPTGKRVATDKDTGNSVLVKDALVSKATDTATGQCMITREDHVITVTYPDGTYIVEHTDGTRMTRFYREVHVPLNEDTMRETGEDQGFTVDKVKVTVIECPGFATVKFDSSSVVQCSCEFGTGTVIHVSDKGTYDIYHADGGYLHIDTDTTTTYWPRPSNDLEVYDEQHPVQFLFRHYADVVLETVDNEGNVFNVSSTGHCTVLPSAIPRPSSSYRQHAPKLFIIHPDGTGTQLLRYQDMADFMTKAEDDPGTAILMDSLPDHPGVIGFTVLKPFTHTFQSTWRKPYIQESIIPKGLVSRDLTTLPAREVKRSGPKFGTTLGRGLTVGSASTAPLPVPILKCPEALLVRQMLQYRPVSAELRTSLFEGLRLYGQFIRTKLQQLEEMKVLEPRDEEQKEVAARLLQEMARVRRELTIPVEGTSEELEASAVRDTYEQAVRPHTPSPAPSPIPKRAPSDWERDKRELNEEVLNRKTLRYRQIPNYFKSEMGKAFLMTQSSSSRAVAARHERSRPPPEGSISQTQQSRSPQSPKEHVTSGSQTGLPSSKSNHQQNGCMSGPLRPEIPTPAVATATDSRTGLKPVKSTSGQSERSRDKGQRSPPQKTPDNKAHSPVKLPGYLLAGRPLAAPNMRYRETEGPVRRSLHTSSVARQHDVFEQLQGLSLLPPLLDLGALPEGTTSTYKVYLKNTGVDLCRFRIKPPPADSGLRVIYQPGPVAAGMKAELIIEVTARRHINHKLEIITETDHMFLPISATVLVPSPALSTSQGVKVQ